MKNIFKVAAIALTLGLAGCAADGQQYRANAFAAEETGFEDGARVNDNLTVKASVAANNEEVVWGAGAAFGW